MKVLAFLLCFIAGNSFGYSVIDSMYESQIQPSYDRLPASSGPKFCLVDEKSRIFANSCYSSLELCEKRLDFWSDIPSGQPAACSKN
jgi:hypothetical protein